LNKSINSNNNSSFSISKTTTKDDENLLNVEKLKF